MKKCNSCDTEKSLDDFNKKATTRDGLQTRCRDCQKAWYKNYYNTCDKEKKRILAKNKIIRDEKIAYIVEVKARPCADCQVEYPSYVMDFDHLGDKEFNISNAINFHSLEKIKKEIAKCEVVCANCHRIRTHDRTFARRVAGIPSAL